MNAKKTTFEKDLEKILAYVKAHGDSLRGTPNYQPPETWRDLPISGLRESAGGDIWALGVLFFVMMTNNLSELKLTDPELAKEKCFIFLDTVLDVERAEGNIPLNPNGKEQKFQTHLKKTCGNKRSILYFMAMRHLPQESIPRLLERGGFGAESRVAEIIKYFLVVDVLEREKVLDDGLNLAKIQEKLTALRVISA